MSFVVILYGIGIAISSFIAIAPLAIWSHLKKVNEKLDRLTKVLIQMSYNDAKVGQYTCNALKKIVNDKYV